MFSCEILFILFSQDPSVTQVRQAAPQGMEEYNPFTDAKPVSAFTDRPVSSCIRQLFNNIHRIQGNYLGSEVILVTSDFG